MVLVKEVDDLGKTWLSTAMIKEATPFCRKKSATKNWIEKTREKNTFDTTDGIY